MRFEQRRRDKEVKAFVLMIQEATSQFNLLIAEVQKVLIESPGYKLSIGDCVSLVKQEFVQLCVLQHAPDAGKEVVGQAKMAVGKAVAKDLSKEVAKKLMKELRPRIKPDIQTDYSLLTQGKSPFVKFSLEVTFGGGGGSNVEDNDEEEDEADDGADVEADDDEVEGGDDEVEGDEESEDLSATLLAAGSTIGRNLFMRALRKKLEPKLEQHSLAWDDVKPALETIDSPEELEAALADPIGFLEKLASASEPMAKKLAIARLRPRLEPKLQKQGLDWADAVPVLDAVDTIDELKAAVDDPDAFIMKLLSSTVGPAAKKLAIARLRSEIEPRLQKEELTWVDVLPLLRAVDTIDELLAAAEDPEAFLEKLLTSAGPAAKKIAAKRAVAKLRGRLEPALAAKGLAWVDVKPVLESIDSLEKLEAALDDPVSFFDKLASTSRPIATKLALAKIRPSLEPHLTKRGLLWKNVVLILEESILSLQELESALDNPDALLKKIEQAAGGRDGVLTPLDPPLKQRVQKPAGNRAAGSFKLDVATLPPKFKRLYDLIFDQSSPRNIVNVFKTIALSFIGVLKNGSTRGEKPLPVVDNAPTLADTTEKVSFCACDGCSCECCQTNDQICAEMRATLRDSKGICYRYCKA